MKNSFSPSWRKNGDARAATSILPKRCHFCSRPGSLNLLPPRPVVRGPRKRANIRPAVAIEYCCPASAATRSWEECPRQLLSLPTFLLRGDGSSSRENSAPGRLRRDARGFIYCRTPSAHLLHSRSAVASMRSHHRRGSPASLLAEIFGLYTDIRTKPDSMALDRVFRKISLPFECSKDRSAVFQFRRLPSWKNGIPI